MGLFGKKKDKGDKGQAKENTKAKRAPKGRAARKGGMNTVFHESVIDSVMEEFAANKNFVVEHEGEEAFVGLMFDVGDPSIGGFDKRSQRNETKGSIIECINSGTIKAYLTIDMMNDDKMVIIPDSETISTMDEYSLLTDATYSLCYVRRNGDVYPADVDVTFAQIADLVMKDESVKPLLGIQDEVEEEEEELEVVEEDTDVPELPDDDDTSEDDSPAEFMPDEEIPTDGSEDGDMPVDDGQADMGGLMPDEYYDAGDGYLDQEGAPVFEGEYGEEAVQQAIVRKYYSDDLGLEVTTEPFDAQFIQGNPYVAFDENRPDGWMNNHLNELCKDANVELLRMHNDNLFRARERFFKLMSLNCDKIQKDLDINNPETVYGAIYQSIQQEKDEREQQMEQTISNRKAEIEKEWQERMERIGEDASREAKAKFRERYQAEHDEKIHQLESLIKSEIEDDYREGMHSLHENRRAEARKLLDLAYTETLVELSDMYMTFVMDENVRRQQLQDGIRHFIDENKQNDLAYSAMRMEELRQQQLADQILSEQTEKMKNMTAEHEQQRLKLQSEIEQIQSTNETIIANTKREYEGKIRELKDLNESLQAQVDKLIDDYRKLDELKGGQYVNRMTELEDERKAWEDKCDNIIAVHKRSNIIGAFLAAVAIIAALAIGFIAGEYMNITKVARSKQQEIINEFNNHVPAGSQYDIDTGNLND